MIGRLRQRRRFLRDHRFVLSRASDYVDDELPPGERERVERHRSVCPACRHLLHTLRAALAELTAMRVEMRVGVPDGIIDRLREETERANRSPALRVEGEMTATSAAVPLIEAEQAPILARPYYPSDGAPSPVTASLAHVPEVLEAALPFIGRVLGPTAIGARTKELVILRTSALMECRYCVQTHAAIALDSGLSREEVRALRGELDVEAVFTAPGELALVAWVDSLTLGRGAMPEEVTARAREAMGDAELVELTLAAGATLMLNRYCSALGLPTSAATLARLAREGLA